MNLRSTTQAQPTPLNTEDPSLIDREIPYAPEAFEVKGALKDAALVDVALPNHKPVIEQLAALNGDMDDIGERLSETFTRSQIIRDHSSFLDKASFSSWKSALETALAELNTALVDKDYQSFNVKLDAYDALSRELHEFIVYEKQQGLVGTCAESGIRVYVKDKAIWLCTPDEKAFSDLTQDQQQRLAEFVKGLTGVEVDFSKAVFQQEAQSGAVNLLGCRLDQLALKQTGEDKVYEVATHVRRGDNTFEERKVAFSLKDLQQGKVGGLLGHSGEIPIPKIGGEELSPELLSALTGKHQFYRDAAYAGIAATVPRAVPGSPKHPSPVDTEQTPRRVNRTTRVQAEAQEQVRQRTASVKKVDVDKLDAPEKLAKALSELDEGRAAYNTALEKRVGHLDAELKRAPGNSRQYRTLAAELDTLKSDHARGVLVEKEILSKQLAVTTDPKAAVPIKSRLYGMAAEVEAAYEQLLGNNTLDDTARKSLQAERVAFQESITAIETEVRGTLARAYDRVRQAAARVGSAELRLPGARRAAEFLADRKLTRTLHQAGEITSLLDSSELGALDASQIAKQAKLLERHSADLRPQIKRLEEQVRAGNADQALQQNLDTLKTADARATVRRAEILERQLNDASPRQAARIREQLYKTLADDIEDAYGHLGNEAAKKQFIETSRQQTTGITALNDEITQTRARIESLEEGLTKEPSSRNLRQDLQGEQRRLQQLQEQVLTERLSAAEQRITKLETRLNDIDNHLAAPNLDEATKAKLQAERVRVQQQHTEHVVQFEQERAKGIAGQLRDEIGKLKEEAQKLDASKENVTDPAQRADIEKASKKLEKRILQRESEMIAAELDGTRKGKALLQDELKKVSAELEGGPEPAKAKQLTQAKKQLEKRLKGIQTAEDYLKGQQELISLERTVQTGEGHLNAAQGELKALQELEQLTPDQELRRTQVIDEISSIEKQLTTTRTNLTAANKQFKSTWVERFNAARRNFDATLDRAAVRMQQNPMRTATIVGAIAEGLRMVGDSDYSADSRHTFLPSLIYLLDSDLNDWIVPVEFTTEQTGEGVARVLQFTSGAGNAAIAMGTVGVAQKAMQSVAAKMPGSGGAGKLLATKTVGRGLSFVGAGLDGYLTFSDLNTWEHADETQMLTKTASPIVMGAGFGAFFGPVGAGLGAAGGAVGEAVGVTHALVKLDRQMESDWRKRGVRDSIRLAEEGYIYPENHPALIHRSSKLNEHERETLNELAQSQLLARMFSGEFSAGELQRMGFVVPAETAPVTELQAAGEHNYQRLVELLEPPSYKVFPLSQTRVPFSTNESQELHDLHPNLAGRLDKMHKQTEGYYEELYRRGTRVDYEQWRERSTLATAGNDILHTYTFGLLGSGPGNEGSSGVRIQQELPTLMAEAGEHYKREMERAQDASPAVRAELGWRALAEKFPQLGQLLAEENSRRTFFSMFNSASGVNLEESEMWTLKTHCETGLIFCRHVMPDELAAVPRALVSEALSNIDERIANL